MNRAPQGTYVSGVLRYVLGLNLCSKMILYVIDSDYMPAFDAAFEIVTNKLIASLNT